MWSLIGGPYEGKYREASVIHDVECQRRTAPWEEVHKRFHKAMLARGVDSKLAHGMYTAVEYCGPRWQLNGELLPARSCASIALENVLSWAKGLPVLESISRAKRRAAQSLQSTRADAEKWTAEIAAVEKAERQFYNLQVQSFPTASPSESAAQRDARRQWETIVTSEHKQLTEQIKARKTAAQAAAAKSRETLLQAEAELQNPIRRPLPPPTIEEIQKLTIADFEP